MPQEQYLLVDGYNIIFSWEDLNELSREMCIRDRDNYERTLNMEERENLNQLLEKKLFQHPLTLRLLGKASGARLSFFHI